MANRAYLSLWTKAFSESSMLEQFERLLGTLPLSSTETGFIELVTRAVDPSEAPLAEHDLRGLGLDASQLIELAREYLHRDVAYEVRTHWDLWVYGTEGGQWELKPQPLAITCHGEEYEGGVWLEEGNFLVEIGLEHLFTGHAGLLNARAGNISTPQHPAEEAFLAVMSHRENLREYQEKTRENIHKLMDWIGAIERGENLERYQLWSEGEENFEARLDEILAVR